MSRERGPPDDVDRIVRHRGAGGANTENVVTIFLIDNMDRDDAGIAEPGSLRAARLARHMDATSLICCCRHLPLESVSSVARLDQHDL